MIQAAHPVPIRWPTQRITDNDWFVGLVGSQKMAIFSQLREPLREQIATFDNSDIARHEGKESIQFWTRKTAGLHLPYGLFRVNNA